MEHENGTSAGNNGGNGESGGTARGILNGYDRLTAGSASLLASLREQRSNGATTNTGTESGSGSQNERRAILTPRTSKRGNTGNDATSQGNDSTARRNVSQDAGNNGTPGNSNRGSSEGTGKSSGTGSRPGRPAKGLNAKPIEKQQTTKQHARHLKLPWSDASPLSLDEATGVKPMLVAALKKFWQGADDFISATNRQKAEAVIWQLIDDEDTEYLVDRLLGAGMVSRPVAAAVRGIARSYHLLNTGMILLPRFMASVQFYAQHGGFSLGGAM